jgi:hypothetical protein
MPEVGFEPTITASEQAKTVHALDPLATMTGYIFQFSVIKFHENPFSSSQVVPSGLEVWANSICYETKIH